MSTSQNGWPVLQSGSHLLRNFTVPTAHGHRTLKLQHGSAGFLLLHNAVYFDTHIERLDTGTWDEWGHAVRPIRGQSTGYSNHASGTACDLNATRHPRGVSVHRTFTDHQIALIHRRLRIYDGCLFWGGDYQHVPDGMHFEINKPLAACEHTARRLMRTQVGQLVLRENPGLRKTILS